MYVYFYNVKLAGDLRKYGLLETDVPIIDAAALETAKVTLARHLQTASFSIESLSFLHEIVESEPAGIRPLPGQMKLPLN